MEDNEVASLWREYGRIRQTPILVSLDSTLVGHAPAPTALWGVIDNETDEINDQTAQGEGVRRVVFPGW